MIMSTMILSFYSLETFSHEKVLSADRRAKVQNALSYSLDYMSRMILEANGTKSNPAIKLYPDVGTKTGFQVRVDLNDPQTPTVLSDDEWVYFTLSGNELSVGGSTLPVEVLTNKIVANFVENDVLPADPTDGFYVLIDSLGNYVDIGLVGRFYPDQAPTLETQLTNPQVEMKTRIFCNNASSN